MERGRYRRRWRSVCAALAVSMAASLAVSLALPLAMDPGVACRAESAGPLAGNLLAAEHAAVLGLEALVPEALIDPRAIAPADSSRRYIPSSERGGRPGVWVWRDRFDLYLAVDENYSEENPVTSSGRPDSLEDVWLVDLEGDGTLDRVLDWEDSDGDGLTDRQLLFALTPSILSPDRMAGIVIEQRDRDRRFWHLDRLQYVQHSCQWKTDFSGEGSFTAVQYDDATGEWSGFDENPFCFYDPDGDGFSDEAVRLSGQGRVMRSARWSWDADGDAGRRGPSNPQQSPSDYDVSIVAVGRVTLPESDLAPLPLRNGQTVGIAPPDSVRSVILRQPWERALLTWDEVDRNVSVDDPQAHERWEGVIASELPGFSQVGGPGGGLFGKRHELDRDASGELALYVSAIDGKVHLFGAEQGWIDWDDTGDLVRDRRLRMEDSDGDGFFDLWAWDRDCDGVDDLERRFPEPRATLLDPSPEGRLPALRAAEKRRLGTRTQAAVFSAERKSWEAGRPPLGR